MCGAGGDAACCQITLTTCIYSGARPYARLLHTSLTIATTLPYRQEHQFHQFSLMKGFLPAAWREAHGAKRKALVFNLLRGRF